jgi:hypothetical protein
MDLAGCLDLVAESIAGIGIAGGGWINDLYCHLCAVFGLGWADGSHAATAETTGEPVPAKTARVTGM